MTVEQLRERALKSKAEEEKLVEEHHLKIRPWKDEEIEQVSDYIIKSSTGIDPHLAEAIKREMEKRCIKERRSQTGLQALAMTDTKEPSPIMLPAPLRGQEPPSGNLPLTEPMYSRPHHHLPSNNGRDSYHRASTQVGFGDVRMMYSDQRGGMGY